MYINIKPFSMTAYDRVILLWDSCDGIGLSDADSEENIRSYLERNPGMSFIAESDGRVVAAVLCGHDGRRGYIHHLAVHSNFRRQGIGRRLVSKCLSELESMGIQKCHLFIFNDNRDGIRFWENIGWTLRADISIVSKTIERKNGD